MTETEYMKQIGCNIQQALDNWGTSQQDLADDTGINKSTISRYINGEVMPSLKNIVNIAYALECDITDLITVYEPIT